MLWLCWCVGAAAAKEKLKALQDARRTSAVSFLRGCLVFTHALMTQHTAIKPASALFADVASRLACFVTHLVLAQQFRPLLPLHLSGLAAAAPPAGK